MSAVLSVDLEGQAMTLANSAPVTENDDEEIPS
jgi:hypothetical protein